MKKLILSIVLASLFTNMAMASDENKALNEALASQSEEVQARYVWRHSKETMEFFGIKPGMTVVEGLPGGGWYSKILLPYLGADGTLIGADYAEDMYPKFGFFSQEDLDAKKTWVADWTAKANGWRTDDDAKVTAFQFGSMPAEMKGTADAVFLVRALHNLARFENDGAYLTAALNDAFKALKPGGVAGVVQHMARAEKSDEWANGSHGYLKESFVIERMEKAGFVFEESSDINANPADQPSEADIVWRLPPSLVTSGEDAELKAQLQAIGESNRMTLRFRKPE
jgi:predicted methyltransferase